MHWRRKWQPTPVFLPGESQGRGSLVGGRLWGRTESDTSDLAAAAAAPWFSKHFLRAYQVLGPVLEIKKMNNLCPYVKGTCLDS